MSFTLAPTPRAWPLFMNPCIPLPTAPGGGVAMAGDVRSQRSERILSLGLRVTVVVLVFVECFLRLCLVLN
jgi:hypothetical protein